MEGRSRRSRRPQPVVVAAAGWQHATGEPRDDCGDAMVPTMMAMASMYRLLGLAVVLVASRQAATAPRASHPLAKATPPRCGDVDVGVFFSQGETGTGAAGYGCGEQRVTVVGGGGDGGCSSGGRAAEVDGGARDGCGDC